MATTFATVTAWMGTAFDPEREHGGRKPPGADYSAPAGYEWIRDNVVVSLFRRGQGLSAYDPRIGELTAGNNITFTNGGDTLTGNAADQYECVDNNMMPDPQSSGMWREEIIWKYQGEWLQVETETDDRT